MTKRREIMHITQGAYDSIRRSFPKAPPERGGFLGGVVQTGVVSVFHLDELAFVQELDYNPDFCNHRSLFERWATKGISVLGMVHSHPPLGDSYQNLSPLDCFFAKHLMDEVLPYLSRLLFPLVTVDLHGTFGFHPFVFKRATQSIGRAQLKIVADERASLPSDATIPGRLPEKTRPPRAPNSIAGT